MFGSFVTMNIGIGLQPAISKFSDVLTMTTINASDAFDGVGLGNETDPDLVAKAPSFVEAKFAKQDRLHSYKWLPLDKATRMRLVRVTADAGVEPSHFDTELKKIIESPCQQRRLSCEILHEDIGNSKKYEALSYTWLGLQQEIPLRVNNSKVVQITASLYACLQRLMSDTDERILWVDQLCIDQENLEERTQQVRMMNQIYQNAEKTIIWLGEDDADSISALKVLSEISDLDETTQIPTRVYPSNLAVRAQALVQEGLRDRSSEAFQRRCAVGKLLNRSWFQRAWIYQEAAVSSRAIIVIGGHKLEFARFSAAAHAFCLAEQDKIRRFGQSLTTNAKGFSTLLAIETGRNSPKAKTTVEDFAALLCRLAGAVKATDDHDLLYAFHAFQDQTKPVFIPDYSVAISDMYNMTAKNIIIETQILDLLGIVGGTSRSGLASWAPDWAVRRPQGHLLCQVGSSSQFSACKGRKYLPVRQSVSRRSLFITGQIIDTVAITATHLFDADNRNRNDFEGFLGLQRHMNEFHLDGNTQQNTDQQKDFQYKRLIKTILADNAFRPELWGPTNSTPPTPFTDRDLDDFLEVYKNIASIWNKNKFLSNLEYLEAMNQQLREKMLICLRKKLFQGEKNRLGLAPADIITGDVVVVLHGCRVPCVLRKNQNEEFYRVIGQCYYEGAMYGEMCNWEENEGVVFEIQ